MRGMGLLLQLLIRKVLQFLPGEKTLNVRRQYCMIFFVTSYLISLTIVDYFKNTELFSFKTDPTNSVTSFSKTTQYMSEFRYLFAAASLDQEGLVLYAGGLGGNNDAVSKTVDIFCATQHDMFPTPLFLYSGPCNQFTSDSRGIFVFFTYFYPFLFFLMILDIFKWIFMRFRSKGVKKTFCINFKRMLLSRSFWGCFCLIIVFGPVGYVLLCVWSFWNWRKRRNNPLQFQQLEDSFLEDVSSSDVHIARLEVETSGQPRSKPFSQQELAAKSSFSQVEVLLANRQWRRFMSYEGSHRCPYWNLKHDSYKTIPVPRDGDCLFYCFQRILQKRNYINIPSRQESAVKTINELRTSISINMLTQNGTQRCFVNGEFSDFSIEGNVHLHCEAIRLGNRGLSSYGGIDEVVSFCNIFNISIQLHIPEIFDPLLFNSKNCHVDNPEMLLLTLGWDSEGTRARGQDHWQILQFKDDQAALSKQISMVSSPFRIICEKDLIWDHSGHALPFSGSFGEVHKCSWLGHDVAVKQFHTSDNFHEFDKEARLMHSIQSFNCVRMYGACAQPRQAIVMEWMGGGNLREYLLQRPIAPMHRRLSLFRQICAGLNSLHSHQPHPIIHSDLKPSNILLDSTKKIAKIGDFGLSKMKASGGLKSSNAAGTILYQSPEILLWSSSSRPQTDVFAMGLILWESLTGKNVWHDDGGTCLSAGQLISKYNKQERPPLSAIPDDVEPDIVTLMQDCWAENPNHRPTAEELWKRMSALDVNNADFNQPLIAYKEDWIVNSHSFEDCLRRALPGDTYKLLLLELPSIEEKYREFPVQELIKRCKLSEVEAKCIIVYTLVWPETHCPRNQQLFFLFCKSYRDRNDRALEKFADFSFNFWNGIYKLPKLAKSLFRGLDRRLSDMNDLYEVGNIVHWHYPSSSTTEMHVASVFSRGGTLISFVGVVDAVSIQDFSLKPSEHEFMLSYTSSFTVEVALPCERARLLSSAFGSLPDNVDLVVLRSRNAAIHSIPPEHDFVNVTIGTP
jgi:serine/threonine protein kinase